MCSIKSRLITCYVIWQVDKYDSSNISNNTMINNIPNTGYNVILVIGNPIIRYYIDILYI